MTAIFHKPLLHKSSLPHDCAAWKTYLGPIHNQHVLPKMLTLDLLACLQIAGEKGYAGVKEEVEGTAKMLYMM